MSELGFVAGRFAIALSKTPSNGGTPPLYPLNGQVEFKPVDVGPLYADGTPITISEEPVTVDLDRAGHILNNAEGIEGSRGVYIPVGHYWVHVIAQYKDAVKPFYIEVTEDHTEANPLDLTLKQPYNPPTGNALIEDRIRAEAAAAIIGGYQQELLDMLIGGTDVIGDTAVSLYFRTEGSATIEALYDVVNSMENTRRQFASSSDEARPYRPIDTDMSTALILGSSSDVQLGNRMEMAFNAANVDITVEKRARGTERWENTLARTGIALPVLTFPNNTIPGTTGNVAVTSSIPPVGTMTAYRGRIEGTSIMGTFSRNGSTYYFARESAGDSVSLGGPVNFIPSTLTASGEKATPAFRDALAFINTGKNNANEKGAWVDINQATEQLVEWLTPLRKRFLVPGFFANSDANPIHKENVAKVNAHRAATYGDRFLDVQGYFMSSAVWDHVGLTRSTQSWRQQIAGVLPGQLANDAAHASNAAWDAFVKHVVFPRIRQLGWLDTPTPIITSDSFHGITDSPLIGRDTDVNRGGDVRKWVHRAPSGDGLRLENSTLRFSDGISSAFITVDHDDIQELSVKANYVAGTFVLAARCSSLVAGFSNNMYRLTATDGHARLERRNDSSTAHISARYPFAVNDTLALRCVGNQISLLINGTVMETTTDNAIRSGIHLGMLNTAASSGTHTRVDDFYVARP